MNYEGNNKKVEQSHSPEDKSEKKLSLSEIDELLEESEKVSDNLDKFFKDDIYKKENFQDLRVKVEKPDDRFDEEAYAKAGFWKKYDNFFRFGSHKDRYGLLKSKDRGLLDKTKINKDVLGKGFEIKQNNNQEREYLKSNVIDTRGDFKDDKSEREIVKAFDIDDVDGKIIKIVGSGRTEKGQIEAAGKMREAEISRLETVNGVELIGLKEAMRKNSENKDNLSKIDSLLSPDGKEKIVIKLNEEEDQTKELIREKEEKLAEETNKFREPLEGRLKETVEMENDLSKVFDSLKQEDARLKKKIREYEDGIRKTLKNFSGEVIADIVKDLENTKAEYEAHSKEFAEKKDLVLSKLEVIKKNRKEIETTLNRVNNIGKTKKEIEQEKKEAEEEKKGRKTETKPTEEKDDAERKEKTWDETRDEAWGLKNMAEKAEDRKTGKGLSDLFPSHDYPGKKKEKTESEWKKEQSESNEKVKFDDNTEIKDLLITNDYLKEIVSDELKKLGLEKTRENKRTVSEIEEKALSSIELINNDLIINRKDAKVKDVRTEFRKWYKQFSENYFKKEGRNEDEDKDESEKNEKEAEKVFTHKEIEEIAMKELKNLGIMDIKDRTMREQITGNVIMAVEAMIAKSKKPLDEGDIKKEVGDWYRKYSKNYFKKGKQSKI